jgi:hypothetical protein
MQHALEHGRMSIAAGLSNMQATAAERRIYTDPSNLLFLPIPRIRLKLERAPAASTRFTAVCILQGTKVQVPGEIFEQQESFSAEVKGWNGKHTDQLVVKFDDGTQVRLPHRWLLQDVAYSCRWCPGSGLAALLRLPDVRIDGTRHDIKQYLTSSAAVPAAVALCAVLVSA